MLNSKTPHDTNNHVRTYPQVGNTRRKGGEGREREVEEKMSAKQNTILFVGYAQHP